MEVIAILIAAAIVGYVLYKVFHKGVDPVNTDEAVVFPSYPNPRNTAPLEAEAIELTISPVEAPVAPTVTVAPAVELAPIEPVATKPAAKKAAAKTATKAKAAPKVKKTK